MFGIVNLLPAQHLPLADLIVVLADSKIEEQGTWTDLRSSKGYISKLHVKESDPQSAQEAAKEKPSTMPGTIPDTQNKELDLSRKTGDLSVYCMLKTRNFTTSPANLAAAYYLKCVSLPVLIWFLASNVTMAVAGVTTPVIIRMWSESGGQHIWFYTGMYALSSFSIFATIVSVIW
jgi:ATP-binding cassette subfamily C (CFTR/MRP) protein 1